MVALHASRKHTLWFQGHWGFQYYMQEAGAKPIDFDDTTLEPGDVVVVPINNTRNFGLDPNYASVVRTLDVPVCPWLTTMRSARGAGFYSSIWGPMPFVFGPAPEEEYQIWRVGSTMRYRSCVLQ